MNLDTVGQLGATWAAVGILTVVLGAICIHNALHEQGVAKRLLFAALALIFLAINFSNALANLSLHSETSRDTKRTAQETVATLKKASVASVASPYRAGRDCRERHPGRYRGGDTSGQGDGRQQVEFDRALQP